MERYKKHSLFLNCSINILSTSKISFLFYHLLVTYVLVANLIFLATVNIETIMKIIWQRKCQSKCWKKYNDEFLRHQASINFEIVANDRENIILFQNYFHYLKIFPVDWKLQVLFGSLVGKELSDNYYLSFSKSCFTLHRIH